MNPVEFLKTIYIGDRGCKSILIDGWRSEVKVFVTCISRVRSSTWDFYTAEDLFDGCIVFEGVTSVAFTPPGLVLNDAINDIRAEMVDGEESLYFIQMNINSVDFNGAHTNGSVNIIARSMALEAAENPGIRIRE